VRLLAGDRQAPPRLPFAPAERTSQRRR